MANPAEHVIGKFGGLTKAARALSVPITTVQGWQDRGRIPQDRWLGIIAVGKSQASPIELSFEDFLADPDPTPATPQVEAAE